ncbi:MAG: MFS transporter [Solirubrobacteraceae bacterium]
MRQLRHQPVAVWAVALACVVSFMGLGLVDPILPAIARQLHASPSDVELLFTSYFAFTGVTMLLSSLVASRIGAKRTLLAGLVLIVVFSALAGASNSVGAIVGLRAGWGLGNALFIATSLSVIVGAATGGVPAAVMVYEAALGLGISVGPLLGGELGGISWRGPFFGVAVLMLVALAAIATRLPATPAPPREQRVSLLAPLKALRHRAVRGSALTAVFYNYGFFTLLGWAPFVMGLGVHQLGYVFTGWGLLLAIFAVFVAPWISRRFKDTHGLAVALAAEAVILAVMGAAHASQAAVIACVIGSGPFLGIANTLMTQVVMESAPVARPVASSAYSFVRFTGGAISPYVAGKLGEHVSAASPFYLGAGMVAVAVGVLLFYQRSLVPASAPTERAGEPAAAPAPPALRPQPAQDRGALLIAVGGPEARRVCALAAPLAAARGGAVYAVHVIEQDILAGEAAIEVETDTAARAVLDACVAELQQADVPVEGALLRSTGTHADVADRILARAAELSATAIVLGPDTDRGPLAAHVTGRIAAAAPCHVIILHPAAGPLGRSNGRPALTPGQLWHGRNA